MDAKTELAHIQVPLNRAPGYVYRLWDAEDNCLYVGKTIQAHPAMRLAGHRNKNWWPEVARCDYIEVFHLEFLGEMEALQISDCKPVHNIVGTNPLKKEETRRQNLNRVSSSGRIIYDVLSENPCTINEIIELVRQEAGVLLKRTTVSQQLNILYRKNLVKCRDEHGRAATWHISKEG